MLKVITTKRFNFIDSTTAVASGVAIGNHGYIEWIVVLVIGTALSILMESLAKNKSAN